MLDFFLTQIIHIAIISILVVFFFAFKRVKLNLKWSGCFLFVLIAHSIALYFGRGLINIEYFFPDLHWNWSGKFAAIIVSTVTLFTLTRLKQGFSITNAGFTFKQNKNSITPSIMVTVLLIIANVILTSMLGGGVEYDNEELLFQATMPGFDEELMYRGVMLYIASLAITSSRFNFFGANLNFSGLLITVLFGLIHGFTFNNGELSISLLITFITGSYGFVFLWLRERTGSLIFPILAHNSVNFIGQFF